VRRFWHPQGGGRGSGAVGPAADGPPRRPADRAVALAALLFVFLPQPTGATILLIAAGLLVVLAVIEFLARPGPPPITPSAQADAPPEGDHPSAHESPPVVVDIVTATQSLT
jgi:hypothetical protein